MMGTVATAMAGTLVYEARMAMRRRVVWISLLPMIGLSVLLALTSPAVSGLDDPVARIGITVIIINTLCTVGVGVALADRFTQHRLPGLSELLDATPSGRTSRMAGVLLGPLAIALAPVAVTLLLLGAVAALTAGSAAPVGAAVIGFLTGVVPGALALTTLAALLGLVLPLAVARTRRVPGRRLAARQPNMGEQGADRSTEPRPRRHHRHRQCRDRPSHGHLVLRCGPGDLPFAPMIE